MARPHSMGGDELHFARHLSDRFGVHSMDESAELLCRMVDESSANQLLFLAHNGPSGLGTGRADIWGCDFRPAEGDQGDRDLQEAVAHARRRGKRVLAVLAGHMHRRLRGGGARRWQLTREGTLYVNAAVVPRFRLVRREQGAKRVERHHVELRIYADGSLQARDRFVGGGHSRDSL